MLKYYSRIVEIRKANPNSAAETRAWHGTTRTCSIGDQGNTQLCRDPQCSVCGIISTSFDIAYYKKNTKWGRFGTCLRFTVHVMLRVLQGVGFIQALSLQRRLHIRCGTDYLLAQENHNAHQRAQIFTQASSRSSNLKAMFIATVFLGNSQVLYCDSPNRVQPDPGYHSVSIYTRLLHVLTFK